MAAAIGSLLLPPEQVAVKAKDGALMMPRKFRCKICKTVG
ncbi:hypothetical protein ABID21_001828 [Pseudorhizobium tarimense]|uniref:Uncharacterized protein n=1 Tax=Pseudorhizobium tarimense TaxID=1079109 RepID=A0ABV2H591_9HYPH